MNRHANVGFEVMIDLSTLGSMAMGGGLLSNYLHVRLDVPVPTEGQPDNSGKLVADFIRKHAHLTPYNNNAGGEGIAADVAQWMRRFADGVEEHLLELNGFSSGRMTSFDADNAQTQATIQIRPTFHFPVGANIPEM